MEKLNIAELLKDCPKGMELDCTMYEDVYFDHVNKQVIYCYIQREHHKTSISFNNRGTVTGDPKSKCVIFPKGKTTWKEFHRPFKDGDIVTWDDRGSLVACIYKKRKNTAFFHHHIALYKGGLGITKNGGIALTDNDLCFASEEEKQKLFDAIKANGYKWNPETKTLEKLIELKFKVGDSIKLNNSTSIYTIVDILKDRYRATTNSYSLHEIEFERQDAYKLVLKKFDITTLKTFDKVLVRGSDVGCWMAHLFSFYDTNCITIDPYKCISQHNGGYAQCIPYEGNEHLLGTTNNCDDFYKTW